MILSSVFVSLLPVCESEFVILVSNDFNLHLMSTLSLAGLDLVFLVLFLPL